MEFLNQLFAKRLTRSVAHSPLAAPADRQLGREEIHDFSAEACAALESYPWPGNVRELKNVVERAVYRSESGLISQIVFDPFAASSGRSAAAPGDPHRPREPVERDGRSLPAAPMKQAVWELKRRMLKSALERSRYNQRKAAALLGLTYDQFRGLYRRFERAILDRPQPVSGSYP